MTCPIPGPEPSHLRGLRGALKRLLRWRPLLVFAVVIALIAAIYVEAGAGGKKAWEKCKRELEAKGEVLDWAAYIPAPIPDDQNIFAAPKMNAWFARGAAGISGAPILRGGQNAIPRPLVVAQVTIIPPEAVIKPEGQDIVLSYNRPVLAIVTNVDAAPAPEQSPPGTDAEPAVIPLLVMEDVPLQDAIRVLARQADIRYALDPKVLLDDQGKRRPGAFVSIRWTNITARQALMALLNNYNLVLMPDPKTGNARITAQDFGRPKVFCEADTRAVIAGVLQRAVAPFAAAKGGKSLKATLGYTLLSGPSHLAKPARLVVRCADLLEASEVAGFFPSNAPGFGPLRAERAGTNAFRISLGSAPCYTAAEYLEWSDEFEPEFNLIREALRRPFARIDGDYSKPFQMPVQNFVTVRVLAQTLAQRAQSFLLLAKPSEALKELTLLHDLSRLLEAKPSRRPITLVAAMINVAITGLYVDTIADGFRLGAWTEPELASIQERLSQVDLPRLAAEACREERAAVCQTFETTSPADLHRLWSVGSTLTLSQKLLDPKYWLLNQGPRGWIYQNMVTVASVHGRLLECFNPERHLILPQKLEALANETEKTFRHFSPRTFMAAIAVPNYTRVWKTVAQNQTKVNQALLACALERFRLAEGSYPASLNLLAPRFTAALPSDLIGGAPLHYALKDPVRYQLYSVGWNGVDDGGLVVRNKSGLIDRDGDWVWLPEEKEPNPDPRRASTKP